MSDIERTANSQLKEAYQELAVEHQHILALLDRLKENRTLVDLLPLLDELHSLLLKHFAREQYPGGFYESMSIFSPGHRDDLRTLVDEHNLILSSLRGLTERARLVGPESASAIVRDVTKLTDQLHKHERKEHHLAEELLGV